MKGRQLNMNRREVVLLGVFGGLAAVVGRGRAQRSAGSQPEEVGDVRWLRSYDTAVAQSKKTGKPILVLFQEVPG